MKLQVSDPILVHAPKMTPAVARWGVYAIPRLWRVPTGELVVRFNGEADSMDVNTMQCAKNLYFISYDNGESWEEDPDGEEKYPINVLTGIDPPYKKLSDGDTVFLQSHRNLPPIENTPYLKKFITPCRDAVVRSYRWGDIPQKCRRVSFGRICDGEVSLTEVEMDFPERELHIVSAANSHGEFVPTEEYVQPHIFRLPYFSAVCELGNELVAACCGQNPQVEHKYYTEVYLVASRDGGKTWKKRATVAGGVSDVPYGYGGDGSEISMTADKNGYLYCVMRMDMSSDPRYDKENITDTMLCISRDGGYTWSAPRSVADSSVTPHIVCLGNALVLVYGRPGVHVKYSTDGGESFSESIPIIGKTLTEERADGRSDYESKYRHSCSYSNTFWERISDDEMILLYNDLRYPDECGVPTKAAFVRKIKIER